MRHDFFKESVKLHKKYRGKLEVRVKVPLETKEDLSRAYTPGVALPSLHIAKNPKLAYRYTLKANSVAIVSDGSRVLGLGNIGGLAAIPVMEGKCTLFKRFAGIDGFPICLDTQDPEEIIKTVTHIAPCFGGINLEDIATPKCFYIEEQLRKKLSIPVFHDDQHGTATAILAGLLNALKLIGKTLKTAKIVINGCGAAGHATASLLLKAGIKNLLVLDRLGILYEGRKGLNSYKKKIAKRTNREKLKGTLSEALPGAHVFIGLSQPNVLKRSMIQIMAERPVIFALANPFPEIMPEEAKKGGAYIIATGRSDYPNQINNVLVFPGVFRGLLDQKARQITDRMLISAAKALASLVKKRTPGKIIPSIFDKGVAETVAKAVRKSI